MLSDFVWLVAATGMWSRVQGRRKASLPVIVMLRRSGGLRRAGQDAISAASRSGRLV